MTLPANNVFEAYVESHPTISANPGTLVTPGASNIMGTAVQVLTTGAWSGVTGPGYEIEIEIWNNGSSAQARDTLLTIMKDDAGGTSAASATDWLVHLSASEAMGTAGSVYGAIVYRFPITVPNGCSLFAKAQVNNGTAGTLRINVRIACEPTKPWTLRTGTSLVTLGANTSTSAGVALASATSEPAWTEIATLTADVCFLDFGWCVDDATMQVNINWVDVALGTSGNERIILNNERVFEGAAEYLAWYRNGRYCDGANGEKVFARASRLNGTTDPNESIIIYAVTGRYAPPTPYTVAGTVTIDGTAAANGEDVQIFAIDADGIPEPVTTVQIAGGAGAFTASVPDNTRSYFAKYDDGTHRGVSALDTPV